MKSSLVALLHGLFCPCTLKGTRTASCCLADLLCRLIIFCHANVYCCRTKMPSPCWVSLSTVQYLIQWALDEDQYKLVEHPWISWLEDIKHKGSIMRLILWYAQIQWWKSVILLSVPHFWTEQYRLLSPVAWRSELLGAIVGPSWEACHLSALWQYHSLTW